MNQRKYRRSAGIRKTGAALLLIFAVLFSVGCGKAEGGSAPGAESAVSAAESTGPETEQVSSGAQGSEAEASALPGSAAESSVQEPETESAGETAESGHSSGGWSRGGEGGGMPEGLKPIEGYDEKDVPITFNDGQDPSA